MEFRRERMKKIKFRKYPTFRGRLALWALPSLRIKLKSSFSMKEVSSDELLKVSFLIISSLEMVLIPILVVTVFYCFIPIIFIISSSTMETWPFSTLTHYRLFSWWILLISSRTWYYVSDITFSSSFFILTSWATTFSSSHE